MEYLGINLTKDLYTPDNGIILSNKNECTPDAFINTSKSPNNYTMQKDCREKAVTSCEFIYVKSPKKASPPVAPVGRGGRKQAGGTPRVRRTVGDGGRTVMAVVTSAWGVNVTSPLNTCSCVPFNSTSVTFLEKD